MEASNISIISLPESFRYPPFFSHNQMSVKADLHLPFEEAFEKLPFIYDILMHNGSAKEKPWQNSSVFVPLLLEAWRKKEERLTACFRERTGKGKEEAMISSISFFIVFLFWANELPVESLNNKLKWLERLRVKPVNCMERLNYILENPLQFHSFIQVQQLFHELTKQYGKKEALRNFNNRHASK